MSATIIPFLQDRTFDPDMTRIMGEAYDMARRELHDKGQPDIVNEVIARRIIEIGRTGERAPIVICSRAMSALGLAK